MRLDPRASCPAACRRAVAYACQDYSCALGAELRFARNALLIPAAGPEREFVCGRRDRRARSWPGVRCAAWGGPSCSAAASSCATQYEQHQLPRRVRVCARPAARAEGDDEHGGGIRPHSAKATTPASDADRKRHPSVDNDGLDRDEREGRLRRGAQPCTAQHASEVRAAVKAPRRSCRRRDCRPRSCRGLDGIAPSRCSQTESSTSSVTNPYQLCIKTVNQGGIGKAARIPRRREPYGAEHGRLHSWCPRGSRLSRILTSPAHHVVAERLIAAPRSSRSVIALLAAAEPTTSAGAPLDVLLGVGVLLLFAGVVVRAFAARARRRGVAGTDARAEVNRPGAVGNRTERGDAGAQEPARRSVVTPPRPRSAPLRADAAAPLARVLDRSRRLNVAEDCVASELAALPRDSWLVERGVLLLDGSRIPLLVIGPTGLFVICASDGAWTLHDLEALCGAGNRENARNRRTGRRRDRSSS